MRPKKRIAIFGCGPIAGSVLRLVLCVRGYGAELAANAARLTAPEAHLDVALLVGCGRTKGDRLEGAIWRAGLGTRVVRVAARGGRPEAEWISDVLEKLRIATVRKRDPRPQLAEAQVAASLGIDLRRAQGFPAGAHPAPGENGAADGFGLPPGPSPAARKAVSQ